MERFLYRFFWIFYLGAVATVGEGAEEGSGNSGMKLFPPFKKRNGVLFSPEDQRGEGDFAKTLTKGSNFLHIERLGDLFHGVIASRKALLVGIFFDRFPVNFGVIEVDIFH